MKGSIVRKPPPERRTEDAPFEGRNTGKMDTQKSVETSQQKSPTGTVEQKQTKRGIKARVTQIIQQNKPLSERKYLPLRSLPPMATKIMEGPEIGDDVEVKIIAILKDKTTQDDLSGGENVIQVEIAGKDYVIKPHTFDGEAHVVNSAILRTLGIPNLDATPCRILSADEAKAIAKKLPKTTLAAMGTYKKADDGSSIYFDQISEYAAVGTQINQLAPNDQAARDKETSLLNTYRATGDFNRDTRDFKVAIAKAALSDKAVEFQNLITLGEDPKTAYEARVSNRENISDADQIAYNRAKINYDKARADGRLTSTEWEQAKKELNSSDEKIGEEAANRINKVVSLANRQYRSALTLAGRGPDDVSKRVKDLKTISDRYNELSKQLATSGSYAQKAIVALATVDLIVGMKDHFFAGSLNNFAFDGTTIIAFDNAKTDPKELDLTRTVEASKAWRDQPPAKDMNSLADFIGQQLNGMLANNRAELPHGNPPPKISSDFISAVISETLERLALVSGDSALKKLNQGATDQLKIRLDWVTTPNKQSSTVI